MDDEDKRQSSLTKTMDNLNRNNNYKLIGGTTSKFEDGSDGNLAMEPRLARSSKNEDDRLARSNETTEYNKQEATTTNMRRSSAIKAKNMQARQEMSGFN